MALQGEGDGMREQRMVLYKEGYGAQRRGRGFEGEVPDSGMSRW